MFYIVSIMIVLRLLFMIMLLKKENINNIWTGKYLYRRKWINRIQVFYVILFMLEITLITFIFEYIYEMLYDFENSMENNLRILSNKTYKLFFKSHEPREDD